MGKTWGWSLDVLCSYGFEGTIMYTHMNVSIRLILSMALDSLGLTGE